MVKSEQVQDAVDQKLVKSRFSRYSRILSLAGRRVKRNDQVSEQVWGDVTERALPHGEGNYVGRTGSVQILFIKLSHLVIVYNNDR